MVRTRNQLLQVAMANQNQTLFLIDPYEGDINPGSDIGLKLFNKATAELDNDDKLEIRQEKATAILDRFKQDASNYRWGRLVTAVEVDAIGTTKNVFREHTDIKLEDIKKHARKTWGDRALTYANPIVAGELEVVNIDPSNTAADQPTFYARVRSRMISKRILACLTVKAVNSIMLDKKNFQWLNQTTGHYEIDGPSLLYSILRRVKPHTRIGVATYKTLIANATLAKFNNNLETMLDNMKSNFEKIEDLGKTHEDYILHLFDALLSSKNETFRNFIQRKKDEWEEGNEVNHTVLAHEATVKYNNMVSQHKWNQTDPKDAKIVALTSQLKDIQKKLDTNPPTNPPKNDKKMVGNASWRYKKEGDTKVVDGFTYHWCKHHKVGPNKKEINGMYAGHKPEDHDAATERMKKKYKSKKQGSNNGDSKKKLSLSNSMKAALMTNCNMSEEQANDLWTEVAQNANLN